MLYLQQTPAVDPYELTQYLMFQRQGWQPVEVATGPMDFQYMELELEDASYSNRTYRAMKYGPARSPTLSSQNINTS